MERDCENCVYHTSNGCSKWNCQFETLAEHDKRIRAEAIEELYNKIDEGVCDICEYQNFDGGCFKTCTFEMENAKKWLLSLKEQNK